MFSLSRRFPHSGGDGLIKLWAIKSGECFATYDQHEGKVLVFAGVWFPMDDL